MLPEFIIGNDFFSVSEAKVGVDLNALSPQSLLLIPSSLSAHSGDYFIMMPINPQKVFYNLIDVYNIEAELWENINVSLQHRTTFYIAKEFYWFHPINDWTTITPVPIDETSEVVLSQNTYKNVTN
jgi:hypothetical protein